MEKAKVRIRNDEVDKARNEIINYLCVHVATS